jgi:hypothetical protein
MALGGAVILLAALSIVLILYLLITSLIITATLHKEGSALSACGLICWGIFGIRFCWERGCGVLQLVSRNRTLWSKTLHREAPLSTPAISKKPIRVGAIAWRRLLPELRVIPGYMVRHLRLREVSAEVTLGFPSAPTTGMAYGYFHALKGMMAPLSSVSLQMTPDFDRTICDGQLRCSFEIRFPFLLGYRLLRVGLRGPVRALWIPRGNRP